MKKISTVIVTAMMIVSLCACGKENEAAAKEGFAPALDATTSCHINVAGGYDNFEALETEFDRFNVYYPNVELMFTKVDDYNNMYAAFGDIPESQILSPEEFGLTDDAVMQFRQAVFAVATGEMSIDDAIAGYGSFGK